MAKVIHEWKEGKEKKRRILAFISVPWHTCVLTRQHNAFTPHLWGQVWLPLGVSDEEAETPKGQNLPKVHS